MGVGLLVASALAASTAVVVLRFLPAREPVAAQREGAEPSMRRVADQEREPVDCSRRTDGGTLTQSFSSGVDLR